MPRPEPLSRELTEARVPRKRTSAVPGSLPVSVVAKRKRVWSGTRLNHGPTLGVCSCNTVSDIVAPEPSPFATRLVREMSAVIAY